jgi:hypothetical protein
MAPEKIPRANTTSLHAKLAGGSCITRSTWRQVATTVMEKKILQEETPPQIGKPENSLPTHFGISGFTALTVIKTS